MEVENLRYNRNVTVVLSLMVWSLEPVSLRGSFSAEKRNLRSLVLWCERMCYLYTQGPHESLELVLNVQCVSDDGWLEPRAQDSSTSWSPSFCLCVGVLAGDTAPREIRISLGSRTPLSSRPSTMTTV